MIYETEHALTFDFQNLLFFYFTCYCGIHLNIVLIHNTFQQVIFLLFFNVDKLGETFWIHTFDKSNHANINEIITLPIATFCVVKWWPRQKQVHGKKNTVFVIHKFFNSESSKYSYTWLQWLDSLFSCNILRSTYRTCCH